MPEIVECNDGTKRMKIEGEIYPIRNPVDPTDVVYLPERKFEDKFAKSTDNNGSTSISLEKPDGTKPNDEFEDLTSSQTTSYLSVTYGGGYANKLPKHTSDRDIKDCIMSHLSRLRIINDHRQRILDRTNVLDDLTPRDTLETVNNFLKSINTPKLNNENEAWAKIDAWIDTNFPEETQSTDICETCSGNCEDCEHYDPDPAPDPVKELTEKLLSTCDQTPVGDIFTQISKSNDRILDQVIPTFIKVIDRQMQKIDITIHRDSDNNIVDKHGKSAQVPYIRVDAEGNLTAADIDVKLREVYDALPYELTSPFGSAGYLPTYEAFTSFVETLNIAITTAIKNHYPTINMNFSFMCTDGSTRKMKYRSKDRQQGDSSNDYYILHIEITKATPSPEDDKNLFLRVLRDRIMYYVNNRNYTRLTRDLKDIYNRIPLTALTNNEIAALQNDDVGKLLDPAYSKILDRSYGYTNYLYKFLKMNYRDVFEFFMEYGKYVYVYTDNCYLECINIEPKPRWYSYITQPALRKKVRNEKREKRQYEKSHGWDIDI